MARVSPEGQLSFVSLSVTARVFRPVERILHGGLKKKKLIRFFSCTRCATLKDFGNIFMYVIVFSFVVMLIVVDPKHVRKTYIVAGQVRTFFSTERLIFLIFNTNSQDKRSRVRLSTHLQRQRPWCVSVHTSSHHNNDHCFQLVTRNYSKHVEKLAIVMRISVKKHPIRAFQIRNTPS